jgi:hypothetical protein
MKANELRLNNYVYDNESQDVIQIERGEHIEYISLYDPIPLTEEWLLKFGLMSIKTELGLWNNGDAIYFNYGLEKSIQLKYVHQLQNLYFALTGEELEIKK